MKILQKSLIRSGNVAGLKVTAFRRPCFPPPFEKINPLTGTISVILFLIR
jgi:hypothetical protein